MGKVYIELGEAINAIKSSRGNCDHRFYDEGLMDACSELIGLKPVDVEPVRHGEWIWKELYGEVGYMLVCSECEESEGACEKFDYCPNCGAKMDGGKE